MKRILAATLPLTVLVGATTAAPPKPAAKPKAKPAAATAPPPRADRNAPLTEEQKIVHALNRLGFGPRPGDVARIQAMGLDAYLDLQLHPERIDDSKLDSKLASLSALRLSGEELAALESEARRGAAKMLKKQAQLQQQEKAVAAASSATADGEMADDPAAQMRKRQALFAQMSPEDRKEMMEARQARQAVMDATRQMITDKVIRAVESERQLQEVLVDFWSNHFNIDLSKSRVIKVADERDVIRKHAMGKFRDLLTASAKSPAMLVYLDNFQSVVDNAGGGPRRPLVPPTLDFIRQRAAAGFRPMQDMLARIEERANDEGITPEAAYEQFQQRQKQQPKRGLNENYARELMELHTLGVDGGYTQKDVQEVARCLTGWGLNGRGRYGGSFEFHPFLHDSGEKVVLGTTIPAGGGINDGHRVLDLLASHPSTMRFVSTKLCRRFVADDPPVSLIDKCVATWKSTDGDIREIVRTIVTAPEFYARAAYRQKIKSPFEYAVSSARALGASCEVEPAGYGRGPAFRPGGPGPNPQTLAGQVATMGQPLYQYAFPTGYPEDSRKWVSSGALIARLNFALGLVNGRLSDITLTLPDDVPGSPAETVGRLAERLLHGELSAATRATLLKQAEPAPAGETAAATEETRRLAALVLGSPEFQRR